MITSFRIQALVWKDLFTVEIGDKELFGHRNIDQQGMR
jgi:hypothetical protein